MTRRFDPRDYPEPKPSWDGWDLGRSDPVMKEAEEAERPWWVRLRGKKDSR